MIPVTIETLIVGSAPAPSVVVLRPFGEYETDGRVLPIWIGPTEAASIGMALEGSPRSRPFTHDLTKALMDTSGMDLHHVTIDKVEGTTFFATMTVSLGDEMHHIDARPSDSIALAVRSKAAVYVTDEVMDVASFPYLMGLSQMSEDEQISAFKRFVDTVSPEDFIPNDSISRDH